MSEIEYRRIGASGIKVPAMGIGTVSWGDKRFGYGKTYTRDDLFKSYQTSLDGGMNFFDTSESYGGGVAEQLLGEFHYKDGRPIIVATKFSPAKIYDPSTRFSSKQILRTLDKSLSRLGIETVDLYQLHYPVGRHKLDSYLDAMAETVKTGKAKAIGVSNFNTKLLQYSYEYLAKQNISLVSNEIEYSLLYHVPEKNGMLAMCKELDVALIAILPLVEGILTGKYRVGGAPYTMTMRILMKIGQMDQWHQEGNRMKYQLLLTKPFVLQREKLEPLFEILDEVAKAHNASISQVALNWLRASNPLVIPIPGQKNARQALSNADTLSWQLTQEEFEITSKIAAQTNRI